MPKIDYCECDWCTKLKASKDTWEVDGWTEVKETMSLAEELLESPTVSIDIETPTIEPYFKDVDEPVKCETYQDSSTYVVAAPKACIKCKVPLCGVCSRCEELTCPLRGWACTTDAELTELRHLLAITQKARGYVAISDVLNVPKPFRVISEVGDIGRMLKKMGENGTLPYAGLFVRPCPTRPRHGFVESKALSVGVGIATLESQITDIFNEAQAADPLAELLIVPKISATHNVILTPTKLAVGIGNDGATAGKKSALFPLTGVPFSEVSEDIIRKAGVDYCKEDPYIEAVLTADVRDVFHGVKTKEAIYFTQLRAGVRIPPVVDKDFVPNTMTVEQVIEASGDLLEWEKQTQSITPGTVVYHLGGTLISHYGVHCLYHNVPILTTRKPEIGEVLAPTLKPAMPTPASVIRGLGLGVGQIRLIQTGYTPDDDAALIEITCSQAVAYLLTTAHNAAAMGGDHGTWLGIAAALMLRLGMSASHGEARHKDPYAGSVLRTHVYDLALNDLMEARNTLGYAQWRFTKLQWDSGFGGKKWAKCTNSIIELDKATKAALNDPSDSTIANLVTALHAAINQAHNGGWWLNKFVLPEIFDASCVQSVYSICAAAPVILKIAGMKVDEEKLNADLEAWRTAPDIAIVKPTGHQDEPIVEPEPEVPQAVEESPATEDGDVCMDPTCPVCTKTPKVPDPAEPGAQSNNLNGTYVFDGSETITDAQGVCDKTTLHVQFKISGKDGYFSFNGKFEKPLTDEQLKEIADKTTQPSYSGSENKYFPFYKVSTPTGMIGYIPGIWMFYTLPNGGMWKGSPNVIWNLRMWQQMKGEVS